MVDRLPVGKHLRHPIGAARVECGVFSFCGGAAAPNISDDEAWYTRTDFPDCSLVVTDRLKQAQRSNSCDISGVFRLVKRDPHMGLGRQIVDLIRLHLGEQMA